MISGREVRPVGLRSGQAEGKGQGGKRQRARGQWARGKGSLGKGGLGKHCPTPPVGKGGVRQAKGRAWGKQNKTLSLDQ